MAALATLDDLAAIGAIPVDISLTEAQAVRATRLIEMASASVLGYVGTDAATITADWSAEAQDALAVIVCEIAARRLYSPAAPTADQLSDTPGFLTLRLTAGDKAALDAVSEVRALRSPGAALAVSSIPTTAVYYVSEYDGDPLGFNAVEQGFA